MFILKKGNKMFNRSVNKVVLVGNVGNDIEMKYAANGNAIANFSIATSESWKNKETGEYENKSEWHNISVFGKFAELVGQYVKKGGKVYVEGKLQTRKWQDQSGADRYSTGIIASDIQLLDSKQSGQNQGQPQPQQNNYQQQAPAPQHQPAPQMAPQQQAPRPTPTHAPQQTPAQKRAQQQQSQPANMDFDDSEIPF